MAEIYVDQTSPIKTKIFWGGEIVDADSEVTATVYDITEDATIYPQLDPASPLVEVEASKLENDNGTYQIVLPIDYCKRNRKFKITWHYSVQGDEGEHSSYVDVVTPYANLADVIEDLNIGTDQSDPNYKTYHDLQMAEKYARKLIEVYTAQFFYLYDDKQIVYGSGSNTLPLPFKLNSIHQLYENDVLIVDKIANVNNWIYDPIISETGFGVRVNQYDSADNLVYTSNGMVPPSIYDRGYTGAFKSDYKYKIHGRFGWSSIPDNVQEACMILIGQFFEKDTAWKNKYVKSVSAFDWKFDFMEDAHRGTGNLYADMLLAPYVINGMVAF